MDIVALSFLSPADDSDAARNKENTNNGQENNLAFQIGEFREIGNLQTEILLTYWPVYTLPLRTC